MAEEIKRIETEIEVIAYLQNVRYALDNGAEIKVQMDRIVDQNRPLKYTNKFTIADLFPKEDPIEALKREIKTLTVEDYIETVKDTRFPKRSEMRVFGKNYNAVDDVYIKVRVELLSMNGNHTVFVMSFHYAERPFTKDSFPCRK